MISDIRPFLTYVRSEYLYNLKQGFGYFSPATVFAVSSYANEPLLLHIMVDDTTVFNNIPISAIANSKTAPKIDYSNYDLCPDDTISIHYYEFLSTIENCSVWGDDNSFIQKGLYLFSIEWPNAKKIQHLIELEDGNYVLWPNEKITWGESVPEELPIFNSNE